MILCDNISAVAMTKNPVLHERTKHIDIKRHYIRDLVVNEEVRLEFCRSEQQVADVFTKSLAKEKFEELRDKLGVPQQNAPLVFCVPFIKLGHMTWKVSTTSI